MNVNESIQDENYSLNGSLEDINFNRRNFSDYQDDRKIVKLAALNDKYKLVERPRFLFQFENTIWEGKFATWVFRKHFGTEFFTYVMKCVYDIILVQAAVVANYRLDRIEINLICGIGMLAVKVIEIFALFFRKVKKPRYIPY